MPADRLTVFWIAPPPPPGLFLALGGL